MSSFESVLMQLDTPTAENIVSILRGLVSDSSEAVTIENVVSSLQIILRLDEIAKSEDDSLCIPNFLVEIWNKYLALLKKYSNLLLRTFPASSTIAGKCSTLFSEVENVLKVYALEGIQSLLSLPNYSTDSIGNKRKLLHFFWYTYFIIVYSLLGVIIRTYMSHSQRLSATLALAGSYLTESSKRSATSVLCCYLGLFLTRMKAFEDEKKQACDLLLKAMPSSSESEFHGLLDSIHSGETFDAYTDSLLQSCGRSGYLHLCSLYLLGGTCAAGSVQSSLSVIQCMAAALSQLVCKNFAVLQDEWLEDLMHSSAESILHSARSFEPVDFRAFQASILCVFIIKVEFVGLCVENSRNSFYSLLFYDYFMLLPSDYRKLLLQTLSTLIKSCHPTSPFLSFVSILLRTFEEPQQLDFFFTLLSAQDRHSFHSLHAAPLKELLQSHDPMIRSKSETAILGYVNTPRCRCAQFILILSSISAPLVDKVKRETNALFCELERHFKALILYIESIEYNYRVKSEESSCGNKRKSIQERLQFICGDASTRLLSALTTCVALVSIKALLDEVPASELLQFALMTVGLGVQLCTNDPCKDVLLGCGELTCSLLIRSAAALQTSHLTTVKIIINRLFAIHTVVQREKWSWKYLHLIVSKINIFGSLLPVPLLSSLPTLVPKEALVLLQGHRASRTASIQTQQLIKVPYSSSSGLSTDLLDQCFT